MPSDVAVPGAVINPVVGPARALAAVDVRFSVAPMLDWTDRHCRYFHRLMTRHARLYTEMVTTGALLFGDQRRHLDFDAAEHPVALQLGGSEPADLAACAKLAQTWGYDEVNLNCGCPSERVQRGAFGACLMREPGLVADCVKAMQDATSLPVTVKHRISVDVPAGAENDDSDYGFLRDFVGALVDAGCQHVIVHARTAILKGLSPKENREIPPLRPALVHRLKRDFPRLLIAINGGYASVDHIDQVLQAPLAHQGALPGTLDGVMVGRAAYQDPWMLQGVDARWFGGEPVVHERREVIEAYHRYVVRQHAQGVRVHAMVRHCHGLANGLPGARIFRRTLSDAVKPDSTPDLLLKAWDAVERQMALQADDAVERSMAAV